MNEKLARNLRKLSKGNNAEYDIGTQPEYNSSDETFSYLGKLIRPGDIVIPGIPTKLKENCSRLRYKLLKRLF